MHSRRSGLRRRIARAGVPVAAVSALATAVAGCSTGPGDAPTKTEVVYVSATPSGASASAAGPGAVPAALAQSFGELGAQLAQPVGVALAPVGGGEVMTLGRIVPQVAWSTIKVPLALAAQRHNGGPLPAEGPAIRDSDNAAAEALWASLGSPDQAAAAVTEVLREGGDGTATVPAEKRRAEFTAFGQTVWSDAGAATFTAHLPCLPGSEQVLALMGQVSANQQWGLELIENRRTAVKGGWGPSEDGGYVVRQIGVLTKRNGAQTAVALTTHAPGASMDSGIAALNLVGTWLGRHLAALPGGRCG